MKHQSNLEISLERYFNYTSFRLGQKEIIQEIMQENDVLGVLPTGTGKSLCYQLPSKMLKGATIVVSPLISLMIDQVKQLKAINFKEVVALNSFVERSDRRKVYKNLHNYKLIYVSPELLQQNEIRMYLKQIKISLFVIDEAHCISQWGYEFRPDYLKLSSIVESLDNPTILALSATATKHVQNDIMTSLKRPNMIKHIYPMDRDNIAFCVQEVMDDKEKLATITGLLTNYRVPTLIYFSSRKASEGVAKLLSKKISTHRIAFYHGGMEQIDRITIQQQFMNDQLDVICCTSAFGMGINKENIRLIIHYHFSPQIESFIQEVGRAGRNQSSSVSLLLYSRNDEYLPKKLIKNELPSEDELYSVIRALFKLHKEQQKLPINKQQIENTCNINEVQWRFLHNQFEKHGMIIDNNIVYNDKNWEQAIHTINSFIKERLSFKESKLIEMIQWIQEKECLRKNLYKNFQPTYKEPAYQCCSNCGFSFSEWEKEQTINLSYRLTTWQSKLKKTLLESSDEPE